VWVAGIELDESDFCVGPVNALVANETVETANDVASDGFHRTRLIE
jgi:hypothetical protein